MSAMILVHKRVGANSSSPTRRYGGRRAYIVEIFRGGLWGAARSHGSKFSFSVLYNLPDLISWWQEPLREIILGYSRTGVAQGTFRWGQVVALAQA